MRYSLLKNQILRAELNGLRDYSFPIQSWFTLTTQESILRKETLLVSCNLLPSLSRVANEEQVGIIVAR